MKKDATPTIYGVMAEYDNPTDITAAARRARAAGYTHMDAFSPFPVEELMEVVVRRRTRLPWIIFAGGVIGCIVGYFLQYYVHVISYPLNVGGRPLNSWPAFIPPTFETTVLFASLTAAIVMLALNGLPQPYHPVFNVPRFDLASRNRFFLLIEATDPKFNRDDVTLFLRGTRAREVTDVQP